MALQVEEAPLSPVRSFGLTPGVDEAGFYDTEGAMTETAHRD